MSSLYIRLYTDFWTNKKTMKLKTIIGCDAYWIPPRIWSYAADHQIDGDFSSYSSEVLSEIIGCSKHAPSLLQALHDSGFMVDGKLKDWEEHNKFHAVNSDRAKKAANARHEAQRNKKEAKNKEEENTETEQAGHRASSKHAPSINEPKKVTKLTDDQWYEELKKKFPSLDVDAERRKSEAWLLLNPNRQFTRRFFTGWITRAETPIKLSSLPSRKKDVRPSLEEYQSKAQS